MAKLWQDCTITAAFPVSPLVGVAIKGRKGEIAAYPIRIPLNWAAPLNQRGKPMKKILLASTVLAASAGFAAADV
ncbi:MAG: hypothetical protein ACOH2M_19760, partial [Cypionkella sp.]